MNVLVFTKEPAETVDPVVEAMPSTVTEDMNERVVAELEKAGLPADVINRIDIELKKNEDYTSNVSVNRTVEELPEIVTTLIDIFKRESDGKLSANLDKWGLMVDVLGTKGNIPTQDIPYHRRANLNAILTNLVDDVYYVEYKVDSKTKQIVFDSEGRPIITKRYPVNVGVEKRNIDSLNNLAVEGNTRDLEGRILGSYGGGSGVGIDGRLEGFMGKMFENNRGRRR